MKREKNAMEGRGKEGERGESSPFDVLCCNPPKVNSKGLLKMHDMHTTRKYVMNFKK